MNKFSLVVEVRLIKGKIDHPPFFKKIRYFSDPDRVFRLGSQKYHNTQRFLCKKNGRKMLGNNFKTILACNIARRYIKNVLAHRTLIYKAFATLMKVFFLLQKLLKS
jgi:hypothetical protein